MKNTILAAAAALTLALGSASAFAAAAQNHGNQGASDETTAQHDSGVNASTECGNILANSSAYSRDQVENCQR